MTTAYIALGSNLASHFGMPEQTLAQALLAIAAVPGVKLVATSSVHITQPVDAAGGLFANSVCKIDTELNAYALLAALQTIEVNFGRPAPNSPQRNSQLTSNTPLLKQARTLDLDILTYGDAIIQSATLCLPHPRMHERAFVLLPLAEIR